MGREWKVVRFISRTRMELSDFDRTHSPIYDEHKSGHEGVQI